MIWNIITDSSCDLRSLNIENPAQNIHYHSVPFIISADNKDFVDDDNIVVEDMVDAMERDDQLSHTSCPAPNAWLELFRREGNVIAITISKELSGSYNSACVAREILLEEQSDKKIAIINSISAGAGLIVAVRRICQNIQRGLSFEETVCQAEKDVLDNRTIFALSSFNNLIKNGRMSPFVGFIAKKLGFWGIGVGTIEGKIEIKSKVRGTKKALSVILNDIHERNRAIGHIVISHCQNYEMAEQLKAEIIKRWNSITVEIHETRGLCSYYAERHGLIVAYT